MDHYNTLGVNLNSPIEEIKKRYRKLAFEHHPDMGGKTSEFQKIQNAYDILSDVNKRRHYDNMIRRHNHNIRVQRSIMVNVPITLENVANGDEITVRLEIQGKIQFIKLFVPIAINDGEVRRYDNIIENGYLDVRFRIFRHSKFERMNLDLLSTENINIFDLIVGKKIIITDIFSNVLEINIPSMTKPGSKLRISGHGLRLNGKKGDHYVLINSYFPDKISTELFEAMKKEQINKGK